MDEIPNSSEMTADEAGNAWTSLMNDEPVSDEPAPALEADPSPAVQEDPTEPEPTPTPEPTAPVEAPAASVPTWDGQQEAGRAFAALREEARKNAERAAYLQGQLDAAKVASPAPTSVVEVEADPEPDPAKYTNYATQEEADTAFYKDTRAWDRRQAVREVEAKIAPVQQAYQGQQTEASLIAARSSNPAEYDACVQAVNRLHGAMPSLGLTNQVLEAGSLAGAKVLELGRAILAGQVPTATPTQPAAPVVAGLEHLSPAEREAAQRAIAATRAAAGAPPPTPPTPLGPRGVGGAVASAVSPDTSVTVESISQMSLAQTRAAEKSVWGTL